MATFCASYSPSNMYSGTDTTSPRKWSITPINTPLSIHPSSQHRATAFSRFETLCPFQETAGAARATRATCATTLDARSASHAAGSPTLVHSPAALLRAAMMRTMPCVLKSPGRSASTASPRCAISRASHTSARAKELSMLAMACESKPLVGRHRHASDTRWNSSLSRISARAKALTRSVRDCGSNASLGNSLANSATRPNTLSSSSLSCTEFPPSPRTVGGSRRAIALAMFPMACALTLCDEKSGTTPASRSKSASSWLDSAPATSHLTSAFMITATF
mmetsp:Transcript_39233/g.96581  ORF Transcript_39233/g.96581 Transcript_39233/m.96581 type:complete len:279 (-) Transcript_39233:777-1613(-)